MNKTLLSAALVTIGSVSLLAADASPKDDISAAATKLVEKGNYSWKTTVVVPESAQFKPGPTEGQTEKGGYTHLSMKFGDNTTEAVVKGDKAAATNQEGAWQSLADLENAEGPARFLGMMLRNIKTPDAQVVELAGYAKELKKDGEAYASDFTDEGAKNLMRFRRGGDGPTVSNAKGSVKIWVKDGVLAKYEFNVKGSINFNGNDIDVDRATTVEIKDAGTTKVSVPDEAKKKL